MKLVLALAAALVVFAAVSVAAQRRKLRQSSRALGLDAPGVRAADCPGLLMRFALQPEKGLAWVFAGADAPPVSIPIEELAGCELLDFGERKRSLGLSLAGEAAANYLSGAKPLAVLRILRKDPDDPPLEYRLTKTAYHEDFRIFAREVRELLGECSKQAAVKASAGIGEGRGNLK